MLPILTITHPLVDACSMSVLAAGGMSWSRILVYNTVAFALQLPLGVVLDVRPGLVRGGFVAGTSLVCAATLAAAFGANGWGVLVAVCLGNAIFHLTAGKHLLETHGGIGWFASYCTVVPKAEAFTVPADLDVTQSVLFSVFCNAYLPYRSGASRTTA